MKQISENFNSHMFLGSESPQKEYRGRKVEPNLWYIGDKDGNNIEAGPFRDERETIFNFGMLIDTSGT